MGFADLFTEKEESRPFPYNVGDKAEIFHNGVWKSGKIVAGYRFMDGVVTIQTDTGERIWCGESRKDLYRKI